MKSRIYEGRVRHERLTPKRHEFAYHVFMMYLDLDELPALFDKRWFWSASRPALARFRREHHIGPATEPLRDSVRSLVEQETGCRPSGPIRLLTNLSYFGYCFNPVSFYYCFAADDASLTHIVAEVNNTPWGETDTYVLDCTASPTGPWRFSPQKKMHVSPFMPMDIDYTWVLTNPQDSLSVHMSSKRDGQRLFSASMQFKEQTITGGSLARVLCRFPLMTVRIIFAIHWQALRLWLKRTPVYAHPKKNKEVVAP